MNENANHRQIAVIGLGYVGIPLALLFMKKGFHVIGVDINDEKIATLKKGKSYLSDISDNTIHKVNRSGRWMVTNEFQEVVNAEAIIICVPTPLDANYQPDLHFLEGAIERLKPYIQKGQLIILESSTYPGTTEEVLVPGLVPDQWVLGEDIAIGYSPERIDPGNRDYNLQDIPKVISGVTEACKNRVFELYSKVFKRVVPVSSTRTAEMVKILENSQRFINISFINEISQFCRAEDINIWEVIEAAATKPYGFTPYYPGPGIGGHCIPIDPLYLKWKANKEGIETRFIDLAHEVNEWIPEEVVHVAKILLKSDSLQNKKILVVGVTYKKDVNDIRDSSAILILTKLLEASADVVYHDPYIPNVQIGTWQLSSQPLDQLALNEFDCALLLVDHSMIDFRKIVNEVACVIDTRNASKSILNKPNVYLF